MMYQSIDIDEDVWKFLKKNAEPFEDTPNTVLRRLLHISIGRETKGVYATSNMKAEIPIFSSHIPAALQQILEMVFLVKQRGYTRIEATNLIAERLNIAPQTVIDKYCRQLNRKAFEIDKMLEQNLDGFKILLEKRFKNHYDEIKNFFNSLL